MERLASPKRVLFLGPKDAPTGRLLTELGEEVIQIEDPLERSWIEQMNPDFIVSHGYRHIVPAEILEMFPGRAINLHISLLPWNRGADPNLWSFIDRTPKGVTIHHMSPSVDAGDLIAQMPVEPEPDDTLATSYQRLQDAVVNLLREHWPRIREGDAPRVPQPSGGSYHRSTDIEAVRDLLTRGWDTPVRELEGRTGRGPKAASTP